MKSSSRVRLSLAAAGLLAVSLVSSSSLISPSAVASAAAADRYRHYVACRIAADERPSHSCPKRGKKGAFFKALDADANYRICVKFPNDRRLCASHQKAVRGELKINTITSHMVGRHLVTWYVGGKQVGSFSFRIHA